MARKIKLKESAEPSQIAEKVIEIPMAEAIEENYLPYSYYTIAHRALVGDDGIKPVNKRILYSMYLSKIYPTSEEVKAAKISGDVSGAFHPHGTGAIEEALARLAQSFSMRVPLVAPFGSVGTVTGDRAASARYWYAKLTKAGLELVKECGDGAALMGKNYDGTRDEPVMLPVRFPNAIINGAEGISVGYACTLYSHNPDEVIAACRAMLHNPDMTVDDLLKIMKGPDLPTGGVLTGDLSGIRDYYETGRGKFFVRGRYEIHPLKRGTNEIIFYELPYQISPSMIIKQVNNAISKKTGFSGVSSIKELTDKKNGLRLQIKTKTGVNPLTVVNELFKKTKAKQSYAVNITMLDDYKPKQMNMLQLIDNFLQFRAKTIRIRMENKLTKLEKERTRLEAFIAIFLDIDGAVEIIRRSESADTAKTKLMKKFKINSEQADYILELTLRRLTKTDQHKIKDDYKAVQDEIKHINETLNQEDKFIDQMDSELVDVGKIISDPRRTGFETKGKKESKMPVVKDDKDATVVTVLADGSIYRSKDVYNQKKEKNPELILGSFDIKDSPDLLAISLDGRATKVPTNFALPNFISDKSVLGLQEKEIVGYAPFVNKQDEDGLLLVDSNGGVNIVDGGYANTTDFSIVNLEPGVRLVKAIYLTKQDLKKQLVAVSRSGQASVFPLTEIRRSKAGAKTIKGLVLKEGDELADVSLLDLKRGKIIAVTNQGVKVTSANDIPAKKRGLRGVRLVALKKGEYVERVISGNNSVLLDSKKKLIKLPEKTPRAKKTTPLDTKNIHLGYLLS